MYIRKAECEQSGGVWSHATPRSISGTNLS